MAPRGDRTVHADHPAGEEIVRYDSAGKWYVELVPPSLEAGYRWPVSIAEAVAEALSCEEAGGSVHLGLPGGGSFDRLLLAAREGSR